MKPNWTKTETAMMLLQKKDLHKLIRLARRELNERWQEAEALKERISGGFAAMANLMAGVTWALACRAALRESKGHTPSGGKRPQSGEMWLPRELLTAVRHQVKQRGWHPITSTDWETVRQNLTAEARKWPTRPDSSLLDCTAEVAQFRIPFARAEIRAKLSPEPWERFDVGGEA